MTNYTHQHTADATKKKLRNPFSVTRAYQLITCFSWGVVIVLLLANLTTMAAIAPLTGYPGQRGGIPPAWFDVASLGFIIIALVSDFLYRRSLARSNDRPSIGLSLFFIIGYWVFVALLWSIDKVSFGNMANAPFPYFYDIMAIVLFGTLALRIVAPHRNMKTLAFALSVVLGTAAALGLVVTSTLVRPALERASQDFQILSNIEDVDTSVNTYIRTLHALPATLKEVPQHSRGAAELIERDLVRYVPGTVEGTVYRYALCVTYHSAILASMPYSWAHAAGEVCYQRTVDTTPITTEDGDDLPPFYSRKPCRTHPASPSYAILQLTA